MTRLLAFGDVMIDVTVSGSGHDASIELRPGGAALNVAFHARGLGAEAVLAGRVGDDLAGRALAACLIEAGVDLDLQVDPALPTGTFAVVDGELRVDRGANDAARPPARRTVDVAFVSGYLPEPAVTGAAEALEARWLALGLGRLERIPAGFDVIIGDLGEVQRVTGLRDPREAACALAAAGSIACVTLGADGAVAAGEGGIVSARPPVRHRSGERGAGDAFAAALLLALAGGEPLDRALTAACTIGASAAGHSSGAA